MSLAESIIKLRELIGDAGVGMLTSSAPSGELHSRPLTVSELDDEGRLNMLVDANADWVAGLGPGEQVNVSVTRDDDKVWVSVAGTAIVSDDRAAIHRLWNPMAEAFFPDGVDSPNLRVLMVAAGTAEYWDAPSSRVQQLAVMARAALGDSAGKVGESGSLDLKE